jgi:gliding motility-associated-like protein
MFLAGIVNAQNFTNKGKEFWVGYGHNQLFNAGNQQSMVLYLSAEQAANVTVSVNGTTWVRNYAIPANTAIPTDLLPKTGTDDCRITGEGLFTKGVHIVSDVPIVAYAHTYGQYSSGATMLLPVETFSYTYFSVNPEQTSSDSYSWFYVVASEENTTVRITPSRPSAGGQLQGIPFTVNLHKGEMYNVMGKINGTASYDMSGSKIQSLPGADGICHPVGMFSGTSRTFICSSGDPFNSGSDYMMQQVFPLNAWGNKYITALTSKSTSPSAFNSNKYRVYVREPNTLVRKNGVLMTGLVNNFYYDFSSTTADVITATKPVLMAQFIPSANGCGNTGLGDPEMFILSPVEQAINNIVFYNTNKEVIEVNYLTLIIPQNGMASLRIDGSSSFDYTYPHPNAPGYTVVVKQLPLTPGQHTASSDSSFTAITYGLGQFESYGYNAGTKLRNLESDIQIKNIYGPALTTYTCPGTPFHPVFKTTYRPSSILWQLSAVTTGLTPNADVFLDNYPIPTDSVIEFQRKFYLYQLPGNYTFSATGTYTIPVTLTDQLIENCSFSNTLNIPVKVIDGPDADFTISNVHCTNSAVTFTGISSAPIIPNRWLWTFGDGTIDSVKIVNKIYPLPGTYNVNLTVVRTDGCIAPKDKQVTILPAATSDIVQAICEGDSYAGYTTSGTYVDHFVAANGCDSTRTLHLTVKPKSVSSVMQSICEGQSFEGYTTSGTYVDHFTAANGCDSTRTLNLAVKPKATSSITQSICEGDAYLGYTTTGIYTDHFTAANGCDSARTLNLTVKPKSTSSITQSICDGDAYLGYTTTGIYTDHFTAANGCDSARTLNLTVKPKSTSSITQSICEGDAYLGYTATGIYTDHFTAANGCDSARTLSLTVKPKSTSSITQSICEGDTYLGYTATGIYTDHFTAANGCDSARTLNLTVKPKSTSSITQSICEGDTYLGYTMTGIYTDHFTAANGCDSARTLNLTVKAKSTSTITESVCDGQSFAGYSVSGTYIDHFTAVNGCDSTRTLHLTVKTKSTSAITETICEGGSVAGYTTTGIYTDHFIAANGCDSTRTLNLTVKPKSTSVITASVCEGQSYLGYAATGIYTDHFIAANGCDSTRTLNLTVKAKSTSIITKAICEGDSYAGYTTSGTYVDHFAAANGCDSIRTLKLTVSPKPKPDLGPDTELCAGETLTLTAGYFQTYLWQDLSVSDHYVVKAPGAYRITVTNSCGSASDQVIITGKICNPYFPNAFTPNNDGNNDAFRILYAGKLQEYDLQVFNRYGNLIFESKEQQKGWDGSFKGQRSDQGAYIWYCTFKAADVVTRISGTVLLLR